MENGSLVTQQFGLLAEVHGTPVGIDVPDFEDIAAFKTFCESLAKLRSFSPFVVGDAFAKAVEKFGEKKAMSDTICSIADYNPKYIRTCAEVCAAIPRFVRLEGLSFEHHAALRKVKSPGCENHREYPITNPVECPPCEGARLRAIADWLHSAMKNKWTAGELKKEVGAARSTTVREHQRSLDGKDFNAEEFGEVVNSARVSCGNLYDALTVKNLLNKKKDAIDRGAAKSLLSKMKEASEEIEALEAAIEKEIRA